MNNKIEKMYKRITHLEKLVSDAANYIEYLEKQLKATKRDSKMFKDSMWEEYEKRKKLEAEKEKLERENKKIKARNLVLEGLLDELVNNIPEIYTNNIKVTDIQRTLDAELSEKYLQAKTLPEKKTTEQFPIQEKDNKDNFRELIKEIIKNNQKIDVRA